MNGFSFAMTCIRNDGVRENEEALTKNFTLNFTQVRFEERCVVEL